MTLKLRKFIYKAYFTRSNRLPTYRANHYIVKRLCEYRQRNPSAGLRGALALLHWKRAAWLKKERRLTQRAGCFITGRNRGTVRRFAFARTRIKQTADQARLIGLQKSSW